MDVNRRILTAVAEADVWLLAARRVCVIVALLVGAAAALCGAAWIVGRRKARSGGDLFRPACGGPPSPKGKAGGRRTAATAGKAFGRGSINPKAEKLPLKGRKFDMEGWNDGR